MDIISNFLMFLSAILFTSSIFKSVNCDSQLFLNVTTMPRADTLWRDSAEEPSSSRGFKIMPKFMFDSAVGTDNSEEIKKSVEKLVNDAVEFYKSVMSLKNPVKKEGILLSRTCEYTNG